MNSLTANPPPPALRAYTSARVALVRTGVSLTTNHTLEFALAHAQARDAVHTALDVAALTSDLYARNLPSIAVHSAAANRAEYLRRPDLGRTLSVASAAALASLAPDHLREARTALSSVPPASTALTILLADGLSALATQRYAIPLIDALLPLLNAGLKDINWKLTPIVIAEQSRVALGDPIGYALHADLTLVLIGERPGLSSPDSLGAYITWSPCPGRTDAERNCVSNIRQPLSDQDSSRPSTQSGLDCATAARKIAWYLTKARRLSLTGISLREPAQILALVQTSADLNSKTV